MRVTFAPLLLFVSVAANASACPVAEEQAVAEQLPTLKSWESLFASFKAHVPNCDDGYISEGYSEAVVRLLANRWATLPRLAKLSHKSSSFENFVLRHIDASAATEDLMRVQENARHRCLAGNATVCQQVAGAASSALGEQVKSLPAE